MLLSHLEEDSKSDAAVEVRRSCRKDVTLRSDAPPWATLCPTGCWGRCHSRGPTPCPLVVRDRCAATSSPQGALTHCQQWQARQEGAKVYSWLQSWLESVQVQGLNCSMTEARARNLRSNSAWFCVLDALSKTPRGIRAPTLCFSPQGCYGMRRRRRRVRRAPWPPAARRCASCRTLRRRRHRRGLPAGARSSPRCC